MADHAGDDGDDGDIFIYRGGRAPEHITHALIDESIDEIENCAFWNCTRLLQVDTHDGIRKVGQRAFCNCRSLPRINIKSVVEIDYAAFNNCFNLADVEFGDGLETIGEYAFAGSSLEHLKLTSVTTIGAVAFVNCKRLMGIELPERLETIGVCAFEFCPHPQRVAIPLKRDLFEYDYEHHRYNQFSFCEQLSTVDLVGGIHKTVASLHMESWRAEMTAEINRINQVLPNTAVFRKTDEIQQWMEVVMDKMDRYKAEHCRYVKEGITLLELALWKAKLLDETDNEEDSPVERQTKKAKVDSEVVRKERRVKCGADIVIKNVLPFLWNESTHFHKIFQYMILCFPHQLIK